MSAEPAPLYAPSPEDWADLRDRLARAAEALNVEYLRSSPRHNRLLGKAQGCDLALSYMGEYERMASAEDQS